MADTVTTVEIVHQRGMVPATIEDQLLVDDPRDGVNRVAEHLTQIAGGVRGGKVRVTVESSTAVAATLVCTADVSDCTAGDTLAITVPGFPTAVIAVVATGGDNAAGEVSADAASDTAFGDEIAACFNTYPPLARHFTAANVTGTVTVTAKRAGATANGIKVAETATSNSPFAPGATAFAGGVDHGARPTATILCGTPDIVADDTILIGSVTLTWKASASGENEVTLSTTPATAAANLLAKINAHSKLQGLITATLDTATITMTWNGPPRMGELIPLSRTETNSGSVVLGAALFASGSTEAYQAATKTYSLGAA